MNLKMTGDLILIRQTPIAEPKTEWGFVLPAAEEHLNTSWTGTVVAVGPGKKCSVSDAGQAVIDALQTILSAADDIAGGPVAGESWDAARKALAEHQAIPARMPMDVQVGDLVVYSKNLYQEFTIDGEKLIAMSEPSILCVLWQ